MKSVVLLAICLFGYSCAKVYFSETFDKNWEKRWVKSTHHESDGKQGEWGYTAGKFYDDAEADKGIQTSQDARFYGISAEIPEFSNKGKDLIVQYSVKHEQNLDCGGGYIKLLPAGINQKDFHGDDKYNLMFGPDICGSSTKKTHVIFNYKDKNHLIKKEVKCESDDLTHLYTLILHPDNTYEVQIDGKEVQKGSLKEDWDMLPAKEIPDPAAKKPSDWVDDKMIDDPTDKKPAGYDDIPADISDPDAKKPDDWDDELDGEWEAPKIANPEYKGEWRAKKIENPAYKGEWVHPKIANPDYKDDDNLYLFSSNKFVAFDLWQVKSGSIFDDIIVTDDAAEATKFADKTKKRQEGEKKMKEKLDEERKQKDEEERKNKETEEKDDESKDKDEL